MQREVPLRGRVSIGRHPEQDIQILDRVVSKAHCAIELINGRYSVADSSSRNGTYVNGIMISARRVLKSGDEISVGSTTLSFVEDRPEDALMSRVTFHESGLETNIRSRLTGHQNLGFLPEHDIADTEQLRADYEKLRIAVQLQESVGLELDQEKLLRSILDQAFQIFAADRGVILLQNEDAQLVPMVVKSRNEQESRDSIRISQTILREVQEEKSAVLSNDAMMDSRFSGAHSIILERIRSTMSVPLLYEDKLLGVIHLDSQIASGAFTEKDLQILTGFARQAAMNIQHNRLLQQMEREIVARENMKRLLSPQLVEEVINGRIDIKKGGEERLATMLFADIRAFTPLAERTPAQELVNLLNAYFEVMVDVIFAHEGTLDKFVGDEIMAIWGAPIAIDDAEFRAVSCALRMMQSLRTFNEGLRLEFELAQESGTLPLDAVFSPVEVGIGLNTGPVVAGYVGSSRSLSYTVMGDPVNTANRFCSVAASGQIIMGVSTYNLVRDRIDAVQLPPVRLKGKAEPVVNYLVRDFRGAAAVSADMLHIPTNLNVGGHDLPAHDVLSTTQENARRPGGAQPPHSFSGSKRGD